MSPLNAAMDPENERPSTDPEQIGADPVQSRVILDQCGVDLMSRLLDACVLVGWQFIYSPY